MQIIANLTGNIKQKWIAIVIMLIQHANETRYALYHM